MFFFRAMAVVHRQDFDDSALSVGYPTLKLSSLKRVACEIRLELTALSNIRYGRDHEDKECLISLVHLYINSTHSANAHWWMIVTGAPKKRWQYITIILNVF